MQINKDFPDHILATKNSNVPKETLAEIRQNVVQALSEALENLNISHTPQELALHCALAFGMGQRYINTAERIEAFHNWLDKLLPVLGERHNLEPQELNEVKTNILSKCGVAKKATIT